jgi:benzoyl-CoA reductase/2-hydroxyglutaryl-CoA dehydratase subunit BcrC/BadD/HgdB
VSDALGRLIAAADAPSAIADAFRAKGGRVVWTLGWDIPRELVDACGLHPVRLVPGNEDSSAIDALVGAEMLGARGRALLAAISALPVGDALLISHADAEQPQIFATLRELARCGAMALPPVHFLDLLTIDRPATRRYNRTRIEQTIAWLSGLAGKAPDLAGALTRGAAIRAALGTVLEHRRSGHLTGAEAHRVVAAAAILSPADLATLLPAAEEELGARAPVAGKRVLLSGSEIERIGVVDAIEATGAVVVGEDHGWGADQARPLEALADPFDALAAATLEPTAGPFAEISVRADRLATLAAALAPDQVIHLRFAGDDGSAWEAAALGRRVAPLPFLDAVLPADGAAVAAFVRGETAEPASEPTPSDTPGARPAAPRPTRSRKSLEVIGRFGTYQREWFARVRAEALAGAPFAVVNANAPQEMLRALGIPFVVNQWWASIAAAKQQSPRYAALLAAQGLPPAAEAYSSQGVAAAFDHDPEHAPWGGLPTPDILGTVLNTDATAKLFDTWADVTGARLQRFQRSVDCRWDIPIDWWDGLAEDWDSLLEPERLDLFEAELRGAIAELEEIAGTAFDAQRFVEVLDLVNEQETWYRRTRDLVAATVPAPISVVDQMPATMVPQWHRGTAWARDAARAFHDEVAARVAAGEAACPGERLRLMFVGRGVWGDMGFYQRWEESHKAVFICSMYLSLAADGYIRHHDRGRDPMRALAARFVTMGDELRMPTWAGAWHVKEAELHQVDGAMALSDADPLVLRALREAGVPVLELGMDNYVRDPEAEADLDRRVVAFLEGPVTARRARRG